MGRRNGTSASKEFVSKIFGALHELHISPAVIADGTGYSPGYVRQILDLDKKTERWTRWGDVKRTIPGDLARDCDKLKAQSTAPIVNSKLERSNRHPPRKTTS